MRRLTSFVALALVPFLFQIDPIRADLIQIVSPSAYADTEGLSGANAPNQTDRYQQVYWASDFQTLPEGNTTITQFAYRPNGELTTPVTSTYGSITVRLSTTSANPGSLSMTFTENIGPDETLALSATDYVVSTENRGPVGGPKVFDMVYTFQTPFEYDPSQGNLLIDVFFTNHVGGFSVDGVLDATETQLIGNVSLGETANYSYGGAVTQFTVVPEPSTITLFTMIGMVGAFVAWRKRRRT